MQIDAGKPYSRGSYRNIDSLVLNNKIEAIEGLIVNTLDGGVGLRNHTVPSDLEYGGQWTEDLTWIEPITSCVDTNLTFRFLSIDPLVNFTTAYLVDNGGFSEISTEYPYPGLWNDTQNPDLQARAYKGAWMSNALTAVFLNVTYPGNHGPWNSTKGAEFPISRSDLIDPYKPQLNRIQLSTIDGGYLPMNLRSTDVRDLNLSSAALAKFSITTDNFTDSQVLCPGFGGGDIANITNVMIACGYLYGVPQRTDGVDALVYEPGKNWTQNLYICASGIQASVKTVGFSVNGSSSLTDLQIISLEEKRYLDNQSIPLWAVEKSNFTISEVNPLWGMVHNRYENLEGLSTLRAKKFWLPAVFNQYYNSPIQSSDSLASSSAFASAIAFVYGSSTGGSTTTEGPEYTGFFNIALGRLWSSRSRSSTTASDIVNLIYTDIISSAVVGTKSAIRKSSMGAAPKTPNTLSRVTEFTRQVQYNWLYGIPAAIIIAATVFAALLVFLMWIISRFSISYLRELLNQTSTGRLVTNVLHPRLSKAKAPTSQWVDDVGLKMLVFQEEVVENVDLVKTNEPHLIFSSEEPPFAGSEKKPLRMVLYGGKVSGGKQRKEYSGKR
ncbi:MAG: hypothetical protein LQ342_003999 [Letrouitia transgressa]|nr:MAG: hypothetical protein LQ342_003999 [Letrouitia transgressa]